MWQGGGATLKELKGTRNAENVREEERQRRNSSLLALKNITVFCSFHYGALVLLFLNRMNSRIKRRVVGALSLFLVHIGNS